MLAFLRRTSLHTWQITIFHMLDLCGQLSCTAHINHMLERRIHIGIIYMYSNFNKSLTYFHWKILAFARIWTLDLQSTKPMRHQLSDPSSLNDAKADLQICFIKKIMSYCYQVKKLILAVINFSWDPNQIPAKGVPIQGLLSRRIINLWCLSRKVGKSKNWWFGVE